MEYEVVSHPHLPDIRVFVVEIFTRTAHTHREYELCLLLRGGLQADWGDSSAIIHPGEMVLFSPRQPHALRALEGSALLLILQASPQFCNSYFPQAAQVQFDQQVAFPCQDSLHDSLLRLGLNCFTHPTGYEFTAMAEVNQLFAQLIAQVPWRLRSQQPDRSAARVARVAARIDSDYAEPLRLHELAEAEGISPDYLSHAFRKHMGMTFQEYLSHVRLEHAINLVARTNMTITDICSACGYSNPRYLSADFQRQLGCTPAAYRSSLPLQSAAECHPAHNTQQRFYDNEESLNVLNAYISSKF